MKIPVSDIQLWHDPFLISARVLRFSDLLPPNVAHARHIEIIKFFIL